MQQKRLTKCDFCSYCAHGHCNAPKPDGFYCRDANNEFYQYLAELKRKGNKK